MGNPKSTFRGGYYFRNFKGTPRPDIVELELPKQVTIPLRQGFGDEVKACVSEGDQVKAGRIIAKNDDTLSSPVHATISGKVKEIKEIDYRGKTMQAILIEGDGSAEIETLEGANREWQKLDAQKIGDILYASGVSSLGNVGIPTFHNSSTLAPDKVEHIVISALQTDPFAIPAKIWIEGKLDRFAMGVKILQKLLGNAPVHIGISRKEGELAANLREQLKGKDIYLHSLRPKYPQDAPEILTETVTGVQVPYGQKTNAIGAVVIDLSAVLAVYQAVALGQPLVTRVVSLGGQGFRDNLIARIRIGTPVSDIVTKWGMPEREVRYIFGNVLVGDQVMAETPIGREVTAIGALEEDRKRRFMFFMRPGASTDSYSRLFATNFFPGLSKRLETNVHGEKRVCIQCSYCENVCPRPLLPQMLSRYCTHGLEEEAKGIRLLGCVECGLCTYVCPSKISIMTDIQNGIAKLRQDSVI